jgi:hypothetical protein
MKKTKNNRWRLPIIVGAIVLMIMVVLAGAIIVLNNSAKQSTQQTGQQTGGIKGGVNKLFKQLKTEMFTPSDIVNVGVIGSGGMNYKTHCHLRPDDGDILIDFDGGGLLAYNSRVNHFMKNVNIPAGKYKVYLESFDGYEKRANSNPAEQSQEQYLVEFYNNNSKVASSGVTPDLRDRVRIAAWRGVVNNSLNISQRINHLMVRHKLNGANAPHSLRATCMLLKPIVDGRCGSAALVKMLYSSAPTENLCSSGTNTPVQERKDGGVITWTWTCSGWNGGEDVECVAHGKVPPRCGDGIVNGEEQCDDGDNNGQACTAGYGESCNFCDEYCNIKTIVGPSCGDGAVNGDEECDDGGNNGNVPNISYGETKEYCKADCTRGTVTGGECGDGAVNGDEECDDGDDIGHAFTAGYGQT